MKNINLDSLHLRRNYNGTYSLFSTNYKRKNRKIIRSEQDICKINSESITNPLRPGLDERLSVIFWHDSFISRKKLARYGWATLRLECYRELGYALVYMDHLNRPWERTQRRRVIALCEEVARVGRKEHLERMKWHQKHPRKSQKVN